MTYYCEEEFVMTSFFGENSELCTVRPIAGKPQFLNATR